MDGPNPSEMDIKVLIPALTYCLHCRNLYSPLMETTKNLPNQEKMKQLKCKNENKRYRVLDFSTKIHLIIVFMLISSSVNLRVFYSLRNEEKLVVLLVYSWFVRVAASGFRILPYSLVVVVVCSQMKSESGINLYSPQHCSAA